MLVYDRIQKAIHAQHRTLDFLVKKVNKLIEHKTKKEKLKKRLLQGERSKKTEKRVELAPVKQTDKLSRN